MDQQKDNLQQKLSQIKQRVAKQNENNDAYQPAQTVSMDFTTFIFKCIQQKLDPQEFFKIISGCYSILKWVLIEKKAIRYKAEISYYTIVVNYIASLKIRVSPYMNSETQIIFEADDTETDQAAIAKICLHLFESYLEFYLENKKELTKMTFDTFYQKMEKYKKDQNVVQEALKKEQKQLTQEDVDLYMKNEEINDSIRANVKLRQQAGQAIKRFYISKIKNEDLDIQKIQKVKEQIHNDLLEYRQKKKQQLQQQEQTKDKTNNKSIYQVLEVVASVIIYTIILYLIFVYVIKPFFS
ncbi:transmembrane protein, putative (macronuclear) [Tetrahymena thermophila SB210]|uniref:Transmembrane protein, putative n=1 Tax=Tetrahymena thermophila (strain SB210) TaxID=312017 RepID=I7M9B8_TETTS|nr:transmembrane protein, putative [Tetrahymena thermophila SB210]EAS01288.2 transmembrane protein, putative [Tetrahymena thermophila SB210]|eukprot:XP_001021533.2 transmembrane protein, putative [Tetrahymena thermophila SB210]